LSFERIIKQSLPILESIFPGTTIRASNVFINELQSGSLWEDLIVKFIFGNQQKFDQLINNAREKAGLGYIEKHPQVLSAIMISLVLSGGIYALDKKFQTNSEKIETLQNNNNIVINICADMTHLHPDELKHHIEANIRDKEKLSKNAIKVVHPAKRDKNSEITFDQNNSLKLDLNTIQAMPSFVPEDIDEMIEEFREVEVTIRATDLDSKRRGWAAVIPEISDRRVRLQIDPSVNVEKIIAKRTFLGDVTAVFKYDENGNEVPKFYYLRNIDE